MKWQDFTILLVLSRTTVQVLGRPTDAPVKGSPSTWNLPLLSESDTLWGDNDPSGQVKQGLGLNQTPEQTLDGSVLFLKEVTDQLPTIERFRETKEKAKRTELDIIKANEQTVNPLIQVGRDLSFGKGEAKRANRSPIAQRQQNTHEDVDASPEIESRSWLSRLFRREIDPATDTEPHAKRDGVAKDIFKEKRYEDPKTSAYCLTFKPDVELSSFCAANIAKIEISISKQSHADPTSPMWNEMRALSAKCYYQRVCGGY